MRLARITALALLTALCALPIAAQKHPNLELGFNPDRLYHYTELDSVNLFNGNLIVQIPIGGTYHANAAFQYQLTLVYNGKVWDYRREVEGDQEHVYSEPNWRSNAGVGWRLSMGRLLAPSSPAGTHYPSNGQPYWVYEGPSGDEHAFGGDRDAELQVTGDESRLRLHKINNDNRDVQFPNGEIHRFTRRNGRWELRKISDPHGNALTLTPNPGANGRLTWDLQDSTGRHQYVSLTPARLLVPSVSLVTRDSVDEGRLVEAIQVSTKEGTSIYHFEYEALSVDWGCGHRPNHASNGDSAFLTPTVTLPMLKRVVLPDNTTSDPDDNTAFLFDYYAAGDQPQVPATGSGPCGQAMLQDMTVPTGGKTTYEYQIYHLPESFCFAGSFVEINPGVKARITPDGRWDYGFTLGKQVVLSNQDAANYLLDCGHEYEVPGFPAVPVSLTPPRRWARTTVLSPPVPYKTSNGYEDRRQRTDNYFHVWYENEPALDQFSLPTDDLTAADTAYEFGAPFTSGAPTSDDARNDGLCTNSLDGCTTGDDDVSAADVTGATPRHLSTRMYEGCANDGDCTNGRFLRSTYLRSLSITPGHGFLVSTARPSFDSTRTVFEDDLGCADGAACWIQTTILTTEDRTEQDPNRSGYSRQEDTTTNFPNGGGFNTTAHYLGLSKTANDDPDAAWVLDLADWKMRTDGTTTKSEYCFNPTTGFLQGVRVLEGLTRGVKDLLTTFTPDGNGNVQLEKSYGGDAQPVVSVDTACPALTVTPTHRILNSYQHGLLAESHYCDPADTQTVCDSILTTLDLTIDSSGLPVSSRDASGIVTKYTYGADGRLLEIEPAGGAVSKYNYIPATATANARVEETIDAAGDERVYSSYEFDGIGRLLQLKKSLPGNKFSVVDTAYDGLSRKWRVSQPYDSAAPSTRKWNETIFDAFGRPLQITAPDTKKVYVSYFGNRFRERTAAVATSVSGTTDAVVKEYYDAQSRLDHIEEHAKNTSAGTPEGGLVTTEYTYDAASHLTHVLMSDGTDHQDREFDYDGRGFLTREKHPENGETTYGGYDARGHVGTRTDGEGSITYEYDAAERLRKVFRGLAPSTSLLKEFQYSNEDDVSRGKLVSAMRRNELPSGIIDVTETYTYGAAIGGKPTGQLSSRKTLVERVQGETRTTLQKFDYSITAYDQLRLPKTVNMPTCSENGCAVSNGLTSITYGREAGYLTSVGNFGTLAYHPSGMVHTVAHTSSPAGVDTYEATNGMARPSSIQFSGSCTSVAPPVITTGAVCTTTTATASVPALEGMSYAWSITGGTIDVPTGAAITFHPTSTSVTLTVTATNGCGNHADGSTTVTVGGAPAAPVITAASGLCAGASGAASVPALDGVTHAWSIAGGTITSNPNGNTITFQPAGPGVVMLSVTATTACGTSTATKPVIVSAPPTVTLDGTAVIPAAGTVQIPFELSGVGPWSVTWSDGVTQLYAETPAVRIVSPSQATTYQITAITDAFGCQGTASGSFVVTLAAQQHVFAYQKYHSIYSPSHAIDLWIDMDPAPSPTHTYTYKWFEKEGAQSVRVLAGTGREIFAQPGENAVYWAEITGTHGTAPNQYTEVTVSPHMYATFYGDCHMPELQVSQDAGNLSSHGTVQFTALVDWLGVDYQWYRGQSGDTRHPLTPQEGGLLRQVAVSTDPISPYWVRASLKCGASEDSDTLNFTVGDCGPVLIETEVASKTVAFGGNTSLTVDLINVLGPAYTWYAGEGEMSPVSGGTQQTLSLTNIQKSARYWVRVRNTFCSSSAPADSYLATVRVSSCPTITPPAQWPTEFWADLNGTATLSVSAGGATGYQWFKGEVGDESQLIPGATQASYITQTLSTESKYWVRVYGSSGCLVDSPTMTVKICEPPTLTGTNYIRNQNIVPGQWVAFSIPMRGTGLHYQWYEGAFGDTTHPTAQPVDKLMAHPMTSTTYWVDVWSTCGPGGSDLRHYAIANDVTFTATVCPILTDAPVAATAVVMPGTSTTLSIGTADTTLFYQWYVGDPAVGTSTPLGARSHSNSISTPPITQATTFWCAVTSANEQCTVPSAGVTVSVCPQPALQLYVHDDTVAPNTFQAVSIVGVPAEHPEFLSYTWYQGAANDTSHPFSSQAVAGVSPAVTTSYWARVTFTDTNCHVDSAVLTITVCVPSITTQPTAASSIDKTANPNAFVHLTVAANIPNVTYQWYTGQPGNVSNPIAGATSSAYDASPTATTTYWVRVTGSCLTWSDSTAATVTVCYSPAISAVSPTRYVAAGTPAPLTVTATGTSLAYQWFIGAPGVTTSPVANSNSSTIYVSPASTTTYWARVTSAGLCSSNSAAMTVDVCAAPTFSTQPQSQISFSAKPITLTAAASSTTGAVTYQWYQGTSGTTTTPIAGATSASVTVSPAVETSYWVRATTSVCSADSDTATISMCSYPEVVTPSPAEKLIGYGASTTLSLPPLSPVETIQVVWYRGASGDRTTIVGGAQNLTSFTTPALTSDTQYWAEFTHNTCVSRTTTYTVRICVPQITAQPVSDTIQSGQNKTLSITTTSITGQTFQWYTGTAGNTTSPVAGATAASVTVSPTATTSYWVRVTGTCGVSVNSTAATVTVCSPPVITSTTASPAAIQQGSSSTLSVSATATSKTYQWYVGTSGNTSTPVTNGTGGSIVVTPTTTTSYWVQVKTGGFCPANSPTITVDVCTTPVITTQPQSVLITAGQSTTLSVASPTSGVTYQWYQGPAGTTTTPLGTAATQNITPAADAQYWVRLTRGACSIDSNVVTVTVCALTVSLPSVNAASGVNATLTATVTNARAAVIYSWYLGTSGTTTTPVGTTSTPSITVNRTATTNYWVRVTDGTCTVNSATTTLNICVPTITTQPQSSTITSGTSTTLSVAATGAPLTYQWYVGDSGVTTSPISGATSASYTTPALTTLTKYWVRVTGCSTANSATATVTVCIPPSAPAPTKSTTMYPGNTGWVAISASGTGLTYQWYKGQSGDTSNPISGATSATYNFTLSVSQYYWVRVSGTCGSPANSPAILYSVTPTITVQPQSAAVPSGSTALLSVTAAGNYLTYQWYNAANQAISGATAATYTTPPITSSTSYTVRVASGSLVANSDPAMITNCTGPSVWMTAAHHSTHSWTLIMNVGDPEDQGTLKYQWYVGTPGDVTQSTPQGPIGGQQQWYLANVTQPQTWWVRAWYPDDRCYSDTLGYSVY